MKVFFMLIAVFSVVIFAGTSSNRVEDVDPTDYFLSKLAQFVDPLAGISSADRTTAREIALTLLDFNCPKKERQKFVRELLEEEGLQKKEKILWRTRMNAAFSLLETIEKKAPITGKQAITAIAKMITSDAFVFGSLAARKRVFLEQVLKFVQIAKEQPELLKEMEDIRNDKEIAMFVEQIVF